MMNNLKKPISVLLCVLLILSCFSLSAAAYDAPDWDSIWQNDADVKIGINMQPGSNESERNISWYMPENANDCSVSISKNYDMSNAVVYTGKVIKTYQGDCSAKVTVTDLAENTRYYYTCNSGSYTSKVYSFNTEDSDFSALYVTDIHISGTADDINSVKENAGVLNSVIAEAQTKGNISMILSAGDQASSGLRNEYIGLTASPLSKSLIFATAIGNHDTKGVDYKFFNNVPNEYYGIINSYQGGDYWFTRGNALFLVMDSNNPSGSDHHAFVKSAVNANPNAEWRIVLMHHDLWGQTIESRESENKLLRALWTPLFDEFDVDLVLTGHSHCYSVSNVMYNGKSVQAITNGCTVENAEGTVYMVSGSLTRPRGMDELNYGENIAIGTNDLTDVIYNVLDFSENSITVNSYAYGKDGAFASYTLSKTEDNVNNGMSFLRRIISVFTDMIGTVVAFFNNIGDFADLTEDGYKLSVFTDIANNKNTVDSKKASFFS